MRCWSGARPISGRKSFNPFLRTTVATADSQGRVELRHAATLEVMRTIGDHADAVYTVHFSPNRSIQSPTVLARVVPVGLRRCWLSDDKDEPRL